MKGSGILSDKVKQIELTKIQHKNKTISVKYLKKGDLFFLFQTSGNNIGVRIYDDENKLKEDVISKKYTNQLSHIARLKEKTDIDTLMDDTIKIHSNELKQKEEEMKKEATTKSKIKEISHIGDEKQSESEAETVEDIKPDPNKKVELTNADLKKFEDLYNDLNDSTIAVNDKVETVIKKINNELPDTILEMIEYVGNNNLMQLKIVDRNPLALSVNTLSVIDGSLDEKQIGQIIDNEYEIYQMIKDGASKKEITDKIVSLARKTYELKNSQKKTATFASTKDIIKKIHSVRI